MRFISEILHLELFALNVFSQNTFDAFEVPSHIRKCAVTVAEPVRRPRVPFEWSA